MNSSNNNVSRGGQPPRQYFTKNYVQNNRMQLNRNVAYTIETPRTQTVSKSNSIHQRLGFQNNLHANSSNQTGIKSRLGFSRTNKVIETKTAVALPVTKRKLQMPTIRKEILRKNVINNLQTNGNGATVSTLVSRKFAAANEPKRKIIDSTAKKLENNRNGIASNNLIVAERHSIRAQLNPKLQEEIRRLQCKKDFSTPLTLGYTGRTLNERFSTL